MWPGVILSVLNAIKIVLVFVFLCFMCKKKSCSIRFKQHDMHIFVLELLKNVTQSKKVVLNLVFIL